MKKTKVFCIGFHKTGTTSLGATLELLGYKNCHGAQILRKQLGDLKMMELIFRKEYDPLFEIADQYDSLNDNPWFILYKELDVRFPGSKFILMLRDEDSWLASCKKYFREASPSFKFRLWIYGKGLPIGNEQRYLKVYRNHNSEVLTYFKNRPNDLLIINIEDEDKLQKIKGFLNLTGIEIEFPHLNRS
jgi:hypothetical protein